MIELLTAGLAGGLLCYELGIEGRPTDTSGGSSKLFIAIRPHGDWLSEGTASLKTYLKSAPPAEDQGEAQWPGEGSYRRRTEYLAQGIPIPYQVGSGYRDTRARIVCTVELETLVSSVCRCVQPTVELT